MKCVRGGPQQGTKRWCLCHHPAYRPITNEIIDKLVVLSLTAQRVRESGADRFSLRVRRVTAGKPGPATATTPLRMWHVKGPNMSCDSVST